MRVILCRINGFYLLSVAIRIVICNGIMINYNIMLRIKCFLDRFFIKMYFLIIVATDNLRTE